MKKKVAPASGAASTQMRPPCRSKIRRVVAGPTPVPSNAGVMQPLENAQKPVSMLHVEPDAVVADKVDWNALGFLGPAPDFDDCQAAPRLNLSALAIKLFMAWRSGARWPSPAAWAEPEVGLPLGKLSAPDT